ncbi:MAG TPA: hypothetical protein VFX02_12335 [Gammaproteobacteria bacterium]|nr:hypothetical protein [Gammaproteobacteria bacterium]
MDLGLQQLSDLQAQLRQAPLYQRWSMHILAQRSKRMHAAYLDLRLQNRYAAAVDFLIDDLFGPNSLCYRELGLQKAEATMLRVLPEGLLKAVAQAVEFSLLTIRLDLGLAEILDVTAEPGALPDAAMMQRAQRAMAAHEEYRRQISLVLEIGEEIEAIVHKPFVTLGLKMCRQPARVMGLGELQDYLERGVAAFKKMRGSAEFFKTFQQREMSYLQSVFSGL